MRCIPRRVGLLILGVACVRAGADPFTISFHQASGSGTALYGGLDHGV